MTELLIEPRDELVFKGPFTRPSKCDIHLTNPSEQWKVFKVMTTDPRRYVVSPNYGLIGPNSSAAISVQLRQLANDALKAFLDSKQKFQILWRTLSGTYEADENAHALYIRTTNAVNSAKLNCRFEEADSSGESPGSTLSKPSFKEKPASAKASVISDKSKSDANPAVNAANEDAAPAAEQNESSWSIRALILLVTLLMVALAVFLMRYQQKPGFWRRYIL